MQKIFVAATVALALLLPVAAPATIGAEESPEHFELIDGITTVASGEGGRAPGQLLADGPLGVVISRNFATYHLIDAHSSPLRVLDPVEGFDAGIAVESAVVDDVHHRLFSGGSQGNVAAVSVLDLQDPGRAPDVFVLPSEYSRHPVVALHYDHPGSRLYAITSVNNSAAPTTVVVHSLSLLPPSASDPTGGPPALQWSYPVEACQALPQASGLAVDADGFLSFACNNKSIPQGENVSPSSGVVRLDVGAIAPGLDLDPFSGEVDFHPIDADFANGKAVTGSGDRLLLGAASAGNQKLFAFNARHRAWTGAIPLARGNLRGITADRVTGRTYVLQQPQDDVNLVVSDDSRLPVPQGLLTGLRDHTGQIMDPAGVHPVAVSTVGADGTVSQRLFVGYGNLGTKPDDSPSILVYEDRLPLPPEPAPVDPDSETTDTEEGPGAIVTYSGEASAYGARVTSIGGIGSLGVVGGILGVGAVGELPRPNDGDRTTFLGWVSKTRLSGNQNGGEEAKAAAVRAAVDEGTESDLANFPPPPEELAAQRQASTCSSDRDEAQSQTEPGSHVACDLAGESVVARASSVAGPAADAPLQIGAASSTVDIRRDADRGIVVTTTATVRNVSIAIEEFGAIHIGEVGVVSEAVAQGGPGSAATKYEPFVNQVRIVGPGGDDLYRCEDCDPFTVAEAMERYTPPRVKVFGPRRDLDPLVTGSPGGANAVVTEDPFAYQSDKNINNDDLGTVPALQIVVYHDGTSASREVIQLAAVELASTYQVKPPIPVEPIDPASLAIELLDQQGDALAGGMFEVRATAADAAPPVPIGDEDDLDEDAEVDDGDGDGEGEGEGDGDDAGDDGEGISSASTDDGQDAGPEDDDAEGTETGGDGDGSGGDAGDVVDGIVDDALDAGEMVGACVTADDGVGDCIFEDLEPGAYLVTQTAAPAGFAEAPSFPVVLTPGFASTVTFTNIKSTATIEISLTDTDDVALPGGEFAVLADDGDGLLGVADLEVGRCITGDDGTCQPVEVPVGAYVVHQASAPDDLEPADDVAFAFTEPGQSAVLAFVNGRPVAPASPAAPPSESSGTGGAPFVPRAPATVSTGSFAMTPAPPPPVPVVTSEPLDFSPPSGSPLKRVASMPGQAIGFLARSPGDAALFAGVWSLLLAPAYLASRRHKLKLVKEGI